MTTYQPAATVTKALRRDVGIITQQDYSRQGYRVRGGGNVPAAIYVDLSDVLDDAKNRREAANLADTLTVHGWTVEHDDDRVIVRRVPTAKEKAARDAPYTYTADT